MSIRGLGVVGYFIWLSSACAALVVATYFFQFHGELSESSSDWANFGSYVGGVLGPLYAFLAFALGVQTLRQSSQQARRDELLKCVQGYERDFEISALKPVSCESPMIWGQGADMEHSIQEVALRTLLQSDGIDWEYHLSEVARGLKFRMLPNGEMIQDRDVWLEAYSAVEGIFRYIELYQSAGGDPSLVDYLKKKYEIPHNRLKISGDGQY